jgi:hypothetical protein
VNLDEVMAQVGSRLDTIDGLRVYDYPAESIQPPAAVVTWPEDITYDVAYGRGADRLRMWVILLVGDATARTSRQRLGKYANGSGTGSVKAVIQSGAYTAFDSVRVAMVRFDPIEYAGTTYAAATFTLDIIGRGSV